MGIRQAGLVRAGSRRSGTGAAAGLANFVEVSSRDASTPNARLLVAGTNITLTDGGAGGNLTINSTGGTASRGDREDFWLRRGIPLSGIAEGSAVPFFEDCVELDHSTTSGAAKWVKTGGGTVTPVTNKRGGIWTLNSSAGGKIQLDSASSIVGPGSSAKWYMAARFAVTSSIDANDQFLVGCETAGGGVVLAMGVLGAISTTQYILRCGTGTLTWTAFNIDANMHIFEGWQDGSTINFRVDSGTTVSAASSTNNTAAHQTAFIQCDSVGTGTRTMDVDFALVVGEAES